MIDIVKKNDCMGCHACSNICPKKCIDMNLDLEGFRYPKINYDDCIECNICEKVCPIIHGNKINNNPKAFACYNKNDDIRSKSSSGGVFTLISEYVINKGGVVFGAKFDEEFNVVHDYTENINGIKKFRGSKYVQSTIGNNYSKAKHFLDQGRIVLFSGTPCQIGGLKRFLRKDYNNLICIDIICHGVPSLNAWNKYKEKVSNGKKIEGINFRDKKYGWKSYSVKFKFNDGSEYLSKGSEDSYIRGFIGDIYLRPSCHNCRFKTLNRESDITLADFWGIKNILKDMDDDKGTSLIIINSNNGKNIFQDISQFVNRKEVNIDEAIKYNLSAIKSSYCNPRRYYFFKNIDKITFDKLVKKSLMDPLDIRIKIRFLKLIRKFIKI